MAEWDRFVINEHGKAVINGNTALDILELSNERKYFLNKEVIVKKEILTTLKNYTNEELKKKDFEYPIYSQVGHTADNKSGITMKITDPNTLSSVIQEIEESVLKL